MKVSDTSQNTAAKIDQVDSKTNINKLTGSLKGYIVAQGTAPKERPLNSTTGKLAKATVQDALSARAISGARGAFQVAALTKNAAPAPLPEGQNDKAYDGKFVGANGKAYSTATPLSQIPPVRPNNGKQPTETTIYVNGISTNKAGQASSMQAIANATGANVVGIHNSTEGTLKDLIQSLGDKTDIGTNAAVDSVAHTVYDALKRGEPVHLFGHSQGGLIVSRALYDVRRRLMVEDGMSSAQANRAMNKIQVETFGAAASSYPDGPQYVHYVNRVDIVPAAVGLGSFKVPFIGDRNAGAGAVVHRFTDFGDAHDLEKTYLPHRVPFDQARRGQF